MNAEENMSETLNPTKIMIEPSLSKLYNRTFESMLDDFKVTPEVRKICMERYRKSIG